MDHMPEGLIRFVYLTTAAIAGSVTALGAMRWRDMTRVEVALTLMTGFFFAIFVTPWIAHAWLGVAENDIRAVAGLTYVFGSASNILLPVVIRRLRKALGEGEAA